MNRKKKLPPEAKELREALENLMGRVTRMKGSLIRCGMGGLAVAWFGDSLLEETQNILDKHPE